MPSVTLNDYQRLQSAPFDSLLDEWERFEGLYGRAELGKADRYYLLVSVLGRPDAWNRWLYERCREVEAEPDGCIDLWAREHYKSTIITLAGIIQEVARDPEITVGIFSHTKSVARKFLAQIKLELESNQTLQALYPDVFYADPQRESPRWSIDGGLICKRKSNPKEATIEGHGLVDGMPTGAHFGLLVYDDVVTLESVGTPEQVTKTTEAWRLSDNLGARDKTGKIRKWHIGTRYSFADSYQTMLDEKQLKPRIYPATKDGSVDGDPVFLTKEAWEAKKKVQQGPVLAAQMLQNPAAGNQAMFKAEWLKHIDIRPATLNVYIMCDPASSRKKGSDKSAIPVVGIDAGGNKYLLDGYHHKMALAERWACIKGLRKHWMNMPGVQSVKVGYERYGMTSDLEYFEERMQIEREAFDIVELAWPREGPGSKSDRVQRLEPDFRNGRFYLPKTVEGETAGQARVKSEGQGFRIFSPVKRRDENGNLYSLNKNFVEEFTLFPFCAHDDLIDAVSRIYDMEPTAPIIIDERTLEPEVFVDGI